MQVMQQISKQYPRIGTVVIVGIKLGGGGPITTIPSYSPPFVVTTTMYYNNNNEAEEKGGVDKNEEAETEPMGNEGLGGVVLGRVIRVKGPGQWGRRGGVISIIIIRGRI